MHIETKTELLKYQILNQKSNYDIEVYRLFLYDKMASIVDRINDLTFSYKVEIKDHEITSTQCLEYLNEFIRYMKLYFYQISYLDLILEEIIKGANIELNLLFDYKCNDIHNCLGLRNDSQIKERIFKMIISNFIQNAKYIPLIEVILKENDLKLKCVNDYSFKESEKILNILSGIAFCQRGRGNVHFLFINVENRLEESWKYKQNSKSKRYTDDFKTQQIEFFNKEYDVLIKSYNVRKKYLKYFI